MLIIKEKKNLLSKPCQIAAVESLQSQALNLIYINGIFQPSYNLLVPYCGCKLYQHTKSPVPVPRNLEINSNGFLDYYFSLTVEAS